jgi:hypothetical protein
MLETFQADAKLRALLPSSLGLSIMHMHMDAHQLAPKSFNAQLLLHIPTAWSWLAYVAQELRHVEKHDNSCLGIHSRGLMQ